jgi:hypothetical protein
LGASSEEVGQEIKAERTKCWFMSQQQNVECHNMKVGSPYKHGKVNIFRTAVTNQNLIYKRIRNKLKVGNACYCLYKNNLSFLQYLIA